MSIRHYPLKVKKINRPTRDAVSISLEVPEEFKDIFKYSQGQFLSVQVDINGQNFRREYSLCSSPYTDKEHIIASKIISNGTVSSYLYNDLKEGDIIASYPPQGKFFTELKPENEKRYVLIGGGSGITPLLSILKSVLFVEPKSNVILYYGSTSEDSIIFRNELDEISKKYEPRFKIYYTVDSADNSWTYYSGRINENDLMKIIQQNPVNKNIDTEYFICGPAVMMELVKQTLISGNISPEKIHIEYFTAPVHHEEYIPEGEENDVIRERKIKVILEGSEYDIGVPPSVNILDAAIKADLDPPYSCKAGICTTCRAKLYSGKIKMDEREGLSDAEIEEGYILTCQSHPLTDNVKIEYM